MFVLGALRALGVPPPPALRAVVEGHERLVAEALKAAEAATAARPDGLAARFADELRTAALEGRPFEDLATAIVAADGESRALATWQHALEQAATGAVDDVERAVRESADELFAAGSARLAVLLDKVSKADASAPGLPLDRPDDLLRHGSQKAQAAYKAIAGAADEYATLRRLHAALRAVIGGDPVAMQEAGWRVEFAADPPPVSRGLSAIERMRRMATIGPAPWYPSPAEVAAALAARQPGNTPRTSQKAVDLGAVH